MPVQIALALLFFFANGVLSESPLAGEKNFTLANGLQCLAAVIESTVEPYYYTMLWTGDLQGKVKTELVALACKSSLTFALLKYFDLNLLAYALAQLVYSVILLAMYPILVKVGQPLQVTPFSLAPDSTTKQEK